MWPFKRREKRMEPRETGIEEARRERLAAEARLEVTHREVTVPLREMHQANHIHPQITELLRRYAERNHR